MRFVMHRAEESFMRPDDKLGLRLFFGELGLDDTLTIEQFVDRREELGATETDFLVALVLRYTEYALKIRLVRCLSQRTTLVDDTLVVVGVGRHRRRAGAGPVAATVDGILHLPLLQEPNDSARLCLGSDVAGVRIGHSHFVILAEKERFFHFDHVAHAVFFGHHGVWTGLVEQQTAFQSRTADLERRPEDLRAVERIDRDDKQTLAGASIFLVRSAFDVDDDAIVGRGGHVGDSRPRIIRPEGQLSSRVDERHHTCDLRIERRVVFDDIPNPDNVRGFKL